MSKKGSIVDKTAARQAELRTSILDLVREYTELRHPPHKFDPERPSVPVSGKVFGFEEVSSLVDSALEFWLTTGRFNAQFEGRLSKFLGLQRGVLTVNSGSSANLLALTGLTSHMMKDRALKPGDEVLTAAAGFPTTVNPILQNGLTPVFVDVHIPTYNIDTSLLEEAITEKTRAIMVAHTLGNPFDLGTVMDIAKRYDLWVVEDTCDALGATYNGRIVGTFGDVGTLSFYPAHHITMGEGGAVLTKNKSLRRAMESIRDWGRDCYCEPGEDNTCKQRFNWKLGDLPLGYDHKYTYSHLGYNLKITDMQAAVGLAQLDRLPAFIDKRKANFEYLRSAMADLGEWFILPEATPNSDPSWFGFVLTLKHDAPFTRDELVRFLNDKGVATRFLFGGNIVRQPYMAGRSYRVSGKLANSDVIVDRTFWIGVYPALAEQHLDYAAGMIRSFVKRKVAGLAAA